ncbi:MAG: MgtC/SapB family protein [Clostridia bacterium]|nr:MgtC/SapB family protein [Clostridia bacterium]
MDVLNTVLDVLEYLRAFNPASVVVRMVVAMVCGGMIGMERASKRRAAGFRTYMVVCMGATLAMLLNQYIDLMLTEVWQITQTTDAARLGAQVINGIGFLGAGTIILTGSQQVKGLITAAGLWASACMGLAIGAGFYEAALVACLMIGAIIVLFGRVEEWIVKRSRNMNLLVRFESLEDVSSVIEKIRAGNNVVYDVEMNKGGEASGEGPSAIFSIRLAKRVTHAAVIMSIAGVESVRSITEL